jgi:Ca2+-binding EF-hand superfamily protein
MAQDFVGAFGVDKSFQNKNQWSKEQEQQLRDIFMEVDADGSEALSKAEMRPIVKKLLTQGVLSAPAN